MRSSTALAVAALAFPRLTNAGLLKSYELFIALGASYIDNAHLEPTAYDDRFAGPPDFEGRFCNGPVISEHFAVDLFPPLITNFSNAAEDAPNSPYFNRAYAGAVVSNEFTPGHIVPDIAQQVDQLAADAANGTIPSPQTLKAGFAHHKKQTRRGANITVSGNATANFPGFPSSILMVEVGLNTLEAILAEPFNGSDPTSVTARDANITLSVNQLGAALQTLSASEQIHSVSSSKSFDILVFGMFPLEKIPNWSLNGVNLTEVARSVAFWNNEVKGQLRNLTNTNTFGDRFFTWDADAFWNTVDTVPGLFGFNDTTNSCVDFSTNVPCADPDSFLYWDSVHPTTKFAKEIATNVLFTSYQIW